MDGYNRIIQLKDISIQNYKNEIKSLKESLEHERKMVAVLRERIDIHEDVEKYLRRKIENGKGKS